MSAIFKREVRSYFTGIVGCVVIAAIFAFISLYYAANNLIVGMPDFALVLYNTEIVLLFVLPALSMRSFSDERRNKTDQLLLTSPVGIPSIVLGKYFAQLVVFAVPVVLACILPLTMGLFGSLSYLSAYAALFGYFLVGAACIAVGTFLSALTENQILSYMASFAVLLVCYMMNSIQSLFTTGNTMAFIVFGILLVILAVLVGLLCKSVTIGSGVFCAGAVVLIVLFQLRPTWLLNAFNLVLDALALFDPFQDFVGGMFTIPGTVYYLSVIVLFLFLTGQAIERRRWN